eukprot:3044817-Alexandrium_andersonii.AAC.1
MNQSDTLGGGSRAAFSHCSAASVSKTAPACLQMGPFFTCAKHSQFRTMSAGSVPGGTRNSTSTSYECPACWAEAT